MRKFSKEERSWIMYDWADSVFATIMMAAVFPVFFVNISGGEGSLGSMWWAWGMVATQLFLGIAAPIIGSIVDFRGYKKRLFVIFLACGVAVLLVLAAQSTWQLLLLGYVLANIFWSLTMVIYDSYLPDITTKDRMDKVSAWGYAMGYIGGSTIPFLISIILILFGGNFGIDATLAVRISIVMTALWWGLFSIPIIKNVHHKYGMDAPRKGFVTETFKNIFETGKKIIKNKGLITFIIAYFFYIDGVGTVIRMATAYGAELGLGAEGMIGALFVTQIVAVPFSLLFGKLSNKFNPINLITAAIGMYVLICITGFLMGFGLEEKWFGISTALILFWTLAFMVGTVQGGIQAISRSTFGRLVPPDKSGEYFGFFEIFGRFASILGPTLYAVILQSTGRASFSILSIIAIFVAGLTLLSIGRKHIIPQLDQPQPAQPGQ